MNGGDTNNIPRLFGIKNSNRDYSDPETWGKNQFNSSFLAALACYLYSKGLDAVYIKADRDLSPVISNINIRDVLKCNPLGDNVFFAFETPYTPYSRYVYNQIPRNDLVIQDLNGNCLSSLEIKLTAIPDNATCNGPESEFGSEIVIRPDTIIYLACNFIKMFDDNPILLSNMLQCGNRISDWTEANNVLPFLSGIKNELLNIVAKKNDRQSPIILEPIWKTNGKSPILSDRCLDVFIWSDMGMLNLFVPDNPSALTSINRHTRTMVWLYKMLFDYSKCGRFDGSNIYDSLSYNTKNDKAFSTNGSRTHAIMNCSELLNPRIYKSEIKNIILGGGQNLLSPERRFDAIIVNSPDLFE